MSDFRVNPDPDFYLALGAVGPGGGGIDRAGHETLVDMHMYRAPPAH